MRASRAAAPIPCRPARARRCAGRDRPRAARSTARGRGRSRRTSRRPGPTIAQFGDAFIAHESAADTWVIGSEDLELTVGFDASRTLTVQTLVNPTTGRKWDITPGPDTTVTLAGETLTLTASGTLALVSS